MDTFLTIQDEIGRLRPSAGIWRDNEMGQFLSQEYLKRNPEVKIVKVELKIIN